MGKSASLFASVQQRVLWFWVYFLAQTAINAIFISYYVYHTFRRRESCEYVPVDKPGSKQNVSTSISVLFSLGLILHSINFVICVFIEPCMRIYNLRQQSGSYSTLYIVAFGADVLFRFGIIVFSVMQLALLGTSGVAHCTQQKESLLESVSWLRGLAIA